MDLKPLGFLDPEKKGHNMKDLENLTTKEVIDHLCDRVIEHDKISKAQAKKLVLNALIYNCVIDEILGQVDWLMGKDMDERG